MTGPDDTEPSLGATSVESESAGSEGLLRPQSDADIVEAGRRLSPRERDVLAELARIDQNLAGLYAHGHELCRRVTDPGIGYLIAHAGREVARGVVRYLGNEDPRTPASADYVTPEDERNRERIAAVLQLPPDHALVTTWFKLVGDLVASSHYSAQPEPSERIAGKFKQLSELIYGRLAPFFTAHAELDLLISRETPTSEDAQRAHALLVRPQLRQYFFSKLQNPRWLQPLDDLGHFRAPPEVTEIEEGRLRLQAWPQGQFLGAIAQSAPEHVAAILERLPRTLRNPAVWMAVVEAARKMPPSTAVRLVPLVASALETALPHMFPRAAVELVRMLGEAGERAAFKVAEALLWIADTGAAPPGHASRLSPDRWVLARLQPWELQEFCGKPLDSLVSLDPVAAIKMLARVLHRAVDTVAGASGAQETPADSQFWCANLQGSSRREDVRGTLAAAVARAACGAIAATPRVAPNVWRRLQRASPIFERIRWFVLAEVGTHLPDELNEVIASGALLDPPFGARESARLLRMQLANASPQARAVLVYALERGPAPEYMARRVERGHGPVLGGKAEGDTDARARVERALAEWQVRRLRWLHDRIPAELMPLANRLGVQLSVPSPERQALDEVGYYSGHATWVGENSPRSSDELNTMSVGDLAAYLRDWSPSGNAIDGPSRAGLESALASAIRIAPQQAAHLLRAGIPARYAAAVLQGVKSSEHEVEWPPLLPVLRDVVLQLEPGMPADSREEMIPSEGARGVVRAAASLLADACDERRLPAACRDECWALAESLVSAPVTWADVREEQPTSIEDALTLALNTSAGDVVRMVVAVGLWDYGEATRRPVVASRLSALLDVVIASRGVARVGAVAGLGHFVPNLYALVPSWMDENERTLLNAEWSERLRHPAWFVYLLRARFLDRLFLRLRSLYVQTADGIPESHREREASDHWDPSRGLVTHVSIAVVRGLASVGDEDGLVERAFSRVPAHALAEVYWEITRAWSEPDADVSPEMVGRLARLWEWRIESLGAKRSDPIAQQEADGLLNLVTVTQFAPAQAIALGRRTLALASPDEHAVPDLWDHLARFIESDLQGGFAFLEEVVKHQLAAPYSYLPFESVAPPLRAALAASDRTIRARATRLVHELGDRGLMEFASLLHSNGNDH